MGFTAHERKAGTRELSFLPHRQSDGCPSSLKLFRVEPGVIPRSSENQIRMHG